MTTTAASTPRLLVVDDDVSILRLYGEVLRAEGYDVIVAATGAQATQRLDAVNGDVAVLLVDFSLPDIDGSEWVRRVAEKHGPKPTMYISGWTDEVWQMDAAPGQWIMLRKPLSAKKLIAAVNWLARGGERPKEIDEP